ncbi:hypothetical protein [Roseomonas sp. BN140053]|uniref:hypothetical protein n=1 Tax=Roseomonas sp. BN140053 TaxID=3391898 RepID=UPI0039E9ECFA
MTAPARSFIFAPLNNTQKPGMDPNDAVGAFHPGMRMWKTYHEGLGGTVVEHYFNNERGLGCAKVSQGILDALVRGSNSQYYERSCISATAPRRTCRPSAGTRPRCGR